MQSSEFLSIIDKFPSIKAYFLGVFSFNKIPKQIKNKHFLVANTQDDSMPGQHWFCIIKKSHKNYEYFDSLGVNDEKIEKLMISHVFPIKSVVKSNNTPVQLKTSTSCGLFVLYFLIERMHNLDLSFDYLLNEIFDIDCEENEEK